MSRFSFRAACAPSLRTVIGIAVLAVSAGCVSASRSNEQQLELHTILDHREVLGVGCVLSNSAGRWFVVAPGRVTVVRTRDPLLVDCARDGMGSGRELWTSRADARLDTDKLIGNIIVSSPLDGYFDRQSGAGVAYPSTVTVLMRPAVAGAAAGASSGNVVF
jgi:hypothetical protein